MQAAAEKEEFDRARERLTLKHKNTSRWARRALKRGLNLATDEQRGAIAEQLRIGRQLRAKAGATRHEGDSSESGGDRCACADLHNLRAGRVRCVPCARQSKADPLPMVMTNVTAVLEL